MTLRVFGEISAGLEQDSSAAGRPGLEHLRVHGWDVASLSAAALMSLEAEVPAALGWRDGVAISTCQRYEFVSLDDTPAGAAHRVYRGEEALAHIAGLAAGLDSLVLGETQIFGQVRTALSKAPAELRRLTAPALAAARSLRREESFTDHAGHALDYALCHTSVPAGGRLLVLGGGAMGRRVAERGVELGFNVTIATRRPLNLGPAITCHPLDDITSLGPVDVVAGCLGAGAGRYDRQHLPVVTTLAADFGTPRNLGDDLEAPVVTIAGLLRYQAETDSLRERRDALRARLMSLLNQRLVLAGASGDSPLGVMRGEVEVIRRRELARAARLHPDLPLSALDTITRSLVNQIFHRPSLRLRRSGNQELAEELAALFQAPVSRNGVVAEDEKDGNDDE